MEIGNIKFKAKRLDNGKWVEGYFYVECGNTYDGVCEINVGFLLWEFDIRILIKKK